MYNVFWTYVFVIVFVMKIYLHRDINNIYVSGLHDDELTTETDSLIISNISFISCTVRLRKYHTPVEFVKQGL